MIGWTAETIKTGGTPHDYSLRGPERYLFFTIFFFGHRDFCSVVSSSNANKFYLFTPI
jgi:hypothetical protein